MKAVFLLLFGLLPVPAYAQDFHVVSTDPSDQAADVPLEATLEVEVNETIDLTETFPGGLPVEVIVSPADSLHIGSFGINLTFTEVSIDVTHTPDTRYVWILTGARSIGGDLILPHVLTYTTGAAVEGFTVSGVVISHVAVKSRADCIAVFPERALVMLLAEPGDLHQVRAATTLKDDGHDDPGIYTIENVPPGTYWPAAVIDCNADGVLEPAVVDTLIYYDPDSDKSPNSISVIDDNVDQVDFVLAVGGATVSAELPGVAALLPNHPNPFNPRTTLAFRLDRAGAVRLSIYDVLGRRIAVAADGFFPPGLHEVAWDAAGVPSGTYLLRLNGADWQLARPLLLLR